MTDLEREQVAITAALLDQGRLVHGASILIVAITLAGAALTKFEANAFAVIALALFLAELYVAIRVGFDARLFARLAAIPESSAAFDAAMRSLGLLPAANAGRDWISRCRGARRLLIAQGLLVAAQCALAATLLRSMDGSTLPSTLDHSLGMN